MWHALAKRVPEQPSRTTGDDLSMHRRDFIRRTSGTVIGASVLGTEAGEVAGSTRRRDIGFEASDGVTLVGDIVYPTDSNGDIADGGVPLVLSMNPYNGFRSDDRIDAAFPPGKFLVDHGYARAVFDVRGTGFSGGSFRAWGPREQQDYAELVEWIAGRPQNNGKIGLFGASYLAFNQYLAVRALDSDSPVEALFPIVSTTDVWRTVWAPGGLANTGFNAAWWGDTVQANPLSLLLDANEMSPDEFQERAEDQTAGFYDSNVEFLAGQQLGTEHAYREDYWRARSQTLALPHVVEKDIPVFHYSGWFDVFQPETLDIYTELQNLWAGRDQYAPMAPDQEVTPRYQAAVGPYMHFRGDEYVIPLNRDVPVAWFDRFLKGKRNGIDETDTPLHIFQVDGDRWVDTATWPLPERSVDTFYLGGGDTGTAPHSKNDGRLHTSEPAATDGQDTLHWRPTSNPCQQANHENAIFTVPARSHCGDDNREWEATGLAYTTAPLEEERHLAGPSCATIYAEANTTNTSWVAGLSRVAPDGTARQLGKGALLGSFRNLRDDQSWYLPADGDGGTPGRTPVPDEAAEQAGGPPGGSDGKLVRPRPEFTRESEQLVEPGQVERYDVLLTPMFARIPANHRLRLSIQTTAPWASPAANDVDDLVGGTYRLQRNQTHASHLNVTFADGAFEISSTNWGTCNFRCGQSHD